MKREPIHIESLKISGYKSIDAFEIKNVGPFSVFAGANGCGKSNFFDALDFFSEVFRTGLDNALRLHGGMGSITTQNGAPTRTKPSLTLELACKVPINIGRTSSSIHSLLSEELTFPIKSRMFIKRTETPFILGEDPQEYITDDKPDWIAKIVYKIFISRLATGSYFFTESLLLDHDTMLKVAPDTSNGPDRIVEHWSDMYHVFQKVHSYRDSCLAIVGFKSLAKWLREWNLFRISSSDIKYPVRAAMDDSRLNTSGNNLASVLKKLENNPAAREEIIDWVRLIVPSVRSVKTTKQHIDGSTGIVFSEGETDQQFPAHLMSDGTMYLLGLLVAVIDNQDKKGPILIEEPERGLHPHAIRELVNFFREYAQEGPPIWLTTHSESLVRQLKVDELWIVDKEGGKTTMHRADDDGLTDKSIAKVGMDNAWLSNLLDGGLPW